jgi:hypothetical protein
MKKETRQNRYVCDPIDYDGMGNQGRFVAEKKKKKRNMFISLMKQIILLLIVNNVR